MASIDSNTTLSDDIGAKAGETGSTGSTGGSSSSSSNNSFSKKGAAKAPKTAAEMASNPMRNGSGKAGDYLEDGVSVAVGDDLKTPCRKRGELAGSILFLLFNLYFFLCGLGLMGDSFKVLAGKSAGNLFAAADHPIAGLMVGILATVLVQSSSTSTSIVVGLVGSGVMPVRQAIFVIMGANIGTSVTNTIVSLGHATDPDEYQRAFSGATVHDMFNFLVVLVMLPLEWIVGGITGDGGILYWLSYAMTDSLRQSGGGKFTSPISVIVKPVYKALLSVDKNKIKALAIGIPTNATCLTKDGTVGGKALVVAKVDFHVCGNATVLETSLASWDKEITRGVLTKGGAFKGWSDGASGGLGLAISLVVLCLALFFLVWTLKRLFLGSAKNCIRKATGLNGYLNILVGAAMTIAVQSSSIITSALTPLVGVGALPLEDMLPLTLGANIGTTCTALLASIVIGTQAAVQIALCHLCFNIIGILIWYPVPRMRQVPVDAAKWMGSMTMSLRWFPIAYIVTAFFLVPLVLLGLSTMIDVGGGVAAFGWVLVVAIVLGAAGLTYWYKKMGGRKRLGDILEAKKEANIKKHFSRHGSGGGAEVVDSSAVDAVELV
jgi:sodium-dependent phosphate cotransporter